MVSVGLRELTKNCEAFFGEACYTPAPEWTKGGGSYEKVGRVAVRGGSPCDRSCHLGDKNIVTAKHHQGGMQGINSLTSPFSHPPSPTSANH